MVPGDVVYQVDLVCEVPTPKGSKVLGFNIEDDVVDVASNFVTDNEFTPGTLAHASYLVFLLFSNDRLRDHCFRRYTQQLAALLFEASHEKYKKAKEERAKQRAAEAAAVVKTVEPVLRQETAEEIAEQKKREERARIEREKRTPCSLLLLYGRPNIGLL